MYKSNGKKAVATTTKYTAIIAIQSRYTTVICTKGSAVCFIYLIIDHSMLQMHNRCAQNKLCKAIYNI